MFSIGGNDNSLGYDEYVTRVYEYKTEHYKNGQLHRDDGPAVEHSDGTRYWYIHGKLHRENGPAIDCPITGTKKWFLNGQQLSEEEFKIWPKNCTNVVKLDHYRGRARR